MTLTYRTRRRLQRIGTVATAVLLVGILTWLCWVIWLERYVVYTREGAQLRFDLPTSMNGTVALPPEAKHSIDIFYNEGSDAIELGKEMQPIIGYYIDYEALKNIPAVEDDLKHLTAGTAVMIELKGGYGSFYYSSNLSGAVPSASVDVHGVDSLIKTLKSKGFYLVAKISAFRDYEFGNRNVPSGLYMLSRAGLWMDPGGCYWLNPTSSDAVGWVTSVILELKNLGFNEVMLDNFRFPAETTKYIFNGDMDAALTQAANTLVASCSSDDFVISFGVTTHLFNIPDGRCRMYLTNVEAKDVSSIAAQVSFDDVNVHLVFLCDTNDTRFDAYSVLRPLSVAEGIEAQKADQERDNG